MWYRQWCDRLFAGILSKDKELNRLTGTIHYQIEHIADDNQCYEPEYHSSPVVEYEIAGWYNNDVAIQYHATKRYITVFVYHCGNDVGATCASVIDKDNA